MSYHLKAGELVPAGIKRIVREEIESAARQLRGQGEADRDEAIHEARKNIKKIRGVLRLMQPELGEIYRVENIRFRDVGRQLSQFRDAGAMLEVFDALLEKYRGELGRRKLASIRRALMERKEQAEQQNNIAEVLRGISAALREPARRVSGWPLQKEGFEAIAPGLKATFRRGQKALARARKHPVPENYHDWRKRVKEHWYHVRLLESFWSDAFAAYEKSLKELETALGEDHNLVMLREKVLAEPAFYGTAAEVRTFTGLIKKYQKELQEQALDLGEHVYGEKAHVFVRHVRRLWEARSSVSDRAAGRPNRRRVKATRAGHGPAPLAKSQRRS